MFEIVPAKIYTDEDLDWTDQDSRVCREHDNESERNVELAAVAVDNWNEYDTVFIGFPNWWGTMPMAMFTFLESYDFAGKTVIPFCTHEGSALGRSESDIAALIPDADLQKGLAVRGSNVDSAGDDVVSCLEELGFESLADGD